METALIPKFLTKIDGVVRREDYRDFTYQFCDWMQCNAPLRQLDRKKISS